MKDNQKICKYCKYRKNPSGVINVGNISFRVSECKCSKFSYDTEYPDGLYYHDVEDYSAYVETGEYFGCIYFTPKKKYIKKK